MPIYEYKCASCGDEFEKLQKVSATAPNCPACGAAETERRVSLSAFHLKGSGWYSTDYKASSGGSTDAAASSATSGDDGGGASSSAHTCGSGCGHKH